MVLSVTDCKYTCSDTYAVGLIGVNDYMVDVQAPFGVSESRLSLRDIPSSPGHLPRTGFRTCALWVMSRLSSRNVSRVSNLQVAL